MSRVKTEKKNVLKAISETCQFQIFLVCEQSVHHNFILTCMKVSKSKRLNFKFLK